MRITKITECFGCARVVTSDPARIIRRVLDGRVGLVRIPRRVDPAGPWSNGMTAESHSARQGSIPCGSTEKPGFWPGFFVAGDAPAQINLTKDYRVYSADPSISARRVIRQA